MYTLDIKKKYKRALIIYFGISIFCIIFNAVYSIFGHNVHSNYMTLAFLFPLIFGTLVYFIMYLKPIYNRISYNIYNAAIATITLGSITEGVLIISGGEGGCFIFYLVITIVLLALSILSFIFFKNKNKNSNA